MESELAGRLAGLKAEAEQREDGLLVGIVEVLQAQVALSDTAEKPPQGESQHLPPIPNLGEPEDRGSDSAPRASSPDPEPKED